MILAYFLAARRESPSLFAPVQTILPLLNINAVVLGSLIRMMTAANRFGLYSAFLACRAIFLRSSLQFKLTVDTIFLKSKTKMKAKIDIVRYRDGMFSYCNCGNIPGSAEAGVIGVIGPGVAGPIDDGAI
jgi:hypothetical protein